MNRRKFVSSLSLLALNSAYSLPSALAAQLEVETLGSPWLKNIDHYAIRSHEVGDAIAVGVKRSPVWLTEALQIPEDQPLDLVYVLDGGGVLGLVSAIADAQLVSGLKPGFPPLLLVGLDYPEGRPNARTRDYTHNDLAVPLSAEKQPPEETIGGADNFLRFLENELDPMLRSRYNISDRPAGLLGDSYGGTFAFHALRRQSKIFDRFFLGSPGLFNTKVNYLDQFEELLQGELVNDTKLYLSFGSLEMNGGLKTYEEMGTNFNKLVSILRRSSNRQLSFRSKVYNDHTHVTVVAPAFNDALLYLYGPHQPRD
ncbi:MAG: alpha/beta hydrolase-fold protein [Pseudomonadota bacterium]